MASVGSDAAASDLGMRVGAGAAAPRGAVLLLVENHSVPADRRVWAEASSLRRAGYRVSVICPRGRYTDTAPFEARDGVAIHRFKMPFEGTSWLSYGLEYGWALL